MESVRQYLLSITSAALLCGILISLIDKKSAFHAIIKLLSGIFLSVTLISPLLKIEILDLSTYIEGFSANAQTAAFEGESLAATAEAEIIKERTEAYILDKATSLGLEITADVMLTKTVPALPEKVCLNGTFTPYNKSILSMYISEELGISKENQTWM